MTQPNDRRAIMSTLIVMSILVFVVGGIVLQQYMQDEPIATMNLEGKEDGRSYCADFTAYEEDDEKIEIIITNCGKEAFLVDTRRKGGELAPEEEYKIVIRDGDKFTAGIITLDGKSIGSFTF